MPTPEPITERTFKLAENPLWDSRRNLLLWTDIDDGTLWHFDPATGESDSFYEGPKVGGFTLENDGALLLFRVDDIVRLADITADAAIEPILDVAGDATMKRFNDVIATPTGNVLAGTIGADNESGGIYHIRPATARTPAAITKLWDGTGISNGMAFAGSSLLWTCSTTRTIFRAPYDAATDEIGPKAPFINVTEGTPDGCALDTQGHLWSARWGAYEVVRHGPDGEPLSSIKVPTECVSSVAFGGTALETLYITTSGGPLYACRPGASGTLEHRSRIATR